MSTPRPKPDCQRLGLSDAQLASLTGFTSRAAKAVAHLREAWLSADAENARAIASALRALFAESHSFQRNRELFLDVLKAEHERGGELLAKLWPQPWTQAEEDRRMGQPHHGHEDES